MTDRRRQRVLVVFGTRPEAIKMALLARALRDHPDFEAEVCVTAQHRSMLDQVLGTFELEPAFDLDLMQERQGLADLTARITTRFTEVVRSFSPDWVLVQGDTTTAFVAALTAFYEKVSVGHVEAGLRTGLKYSPWPEEMNRQLVSRLADLHFAPTAGARTALVRENIPPDRVHVTGNTVIDALLWVSTKIDTDASLLTALEERFSFLDPRRRLVLVTGHRRESFGEPFREVCHALVDIVRARQDVELLYPVHLNPNVQAPVNAILDLAPADVRARIHLLEPVDYLPFVYLMKRAALLVTDSGGIQEEAPSLGKRCLVTRNDTERPEAVLAGVATLTGTSRECIVSAALSALDEQRPLGTPENPYGDGRAVERIVEILSAQ